MPLEGSYAIWNNRGGSGKTTLTYHLAQKFAVKHPDKTILLIDMCPQCDLSHALLGDDEITHSDYVNQLCTLKKEPMLIGEQRYPKTVSGYLDLCTSNPSTGPLASNQNITVDPRTFLLNVSKFNPQLSRNLYLLCGDASLDLIARSLEEKRNQHPSLSHYGAQAWKHVTCALKTFIRKIAERKGIKLVVFIDVASSFSIITELALAASDKLLIPVTDEHLHRNAFEYMFALLYGFSHPSNVYYYYRHYSFYYRANQHDVKLPKIHLILNKLNKSTALSSSTLSLLSQNQNQTTSTPTTAAATIAVASSPPQIRKTVPSGSSPAPLAPGAFLSTQLQQQRDHNESEWEFIFDVFRKHPQAFNLRQNKPVPQTLADFKQEFVLDICEQTSLSNEQVRLAVKSHSPLLSNFRKPTNTGATTPNHAHSSSLSINLPSSSRNTNTNNNSGLSGAKSSSSVVSSPQSSIRLANHHPTPSSNANTRSSSIAAAVTSSFRKTSASVSPPPPASPTISPQPPPSHQHHNRKDSASVLLSVHDVHMQDAQSIGVTTVHTLTNSNTQAATTADPNAILLFDKLLDKIVDGLIVTNER